jgi:hypothetical protein
MRVNSTKHESKRSSRATRWALLGFGTPLFLLLALFVVYFLHNRLPQINIPTPAVPKNNAYDDFVRAGNLALTHKNLSPDWILQPQQPETLADFSAYAKVTEPILSIVQKALNKPCLTPPIRSNNNPYSNDHSALRELSRLIGALSRYYEMRNEPFKAASICMDGYEMWAHLGHGASHLGAMTEEACEELISYRWAPLLGKLTHSELIEVGKRLDKIENQRVDFSEVVTNQGRESVATSLENLKDPKSLGSLSAVTERIRFDEEVKSFSGVGDFMNMALRNTQPTPTWSHKWAAVKFRMADKYQMIQDNRRYFAALSEEMRKPYTGVSNVKMPNNVMLFDLSLKIRPSFILRGILNRLFRTEAALRVYKFQHKVYPTTLNELVPRYMPSLPMDPFAGAIPSPLKYKPLKNGTDFLLYSLGPDLKDDHGASRFLVGSQDTGDIVLGHLWPKRKGPQ